MDNMFKSAYFGKPYKTRDEKKALYWRFDGIYHHLIFEDTCDFTPLYDDNGKHHTYKEGDSPYDIVSELPGTVDEDRLNAILDEAEAMRETAIGRQQTGGWYWRRWAEWGYRKAKEE